MTDDTADELLKEAGIPKSHGLACQACRHRKLRCDREVPCGRCQHLGLTCLPTVKKRRKPRAIGMQHKIARLEALVNAFAQGDVVRPRGNAEHASESSEVPDSPHRSSTLPLHHTGQAPGRSRFEDFVKTIGEEVRALHNIDSSDEEDASERSPPLPDDRNLPEKFSRLSGSADLQQDAISTAMRLNLFQYYCDHLEPMFKIFHRPSLEGLVCRSSWYLGQPPNAPCNQAIIAVVLFAAAHAMSAPELRERFGLFDQYALKELKLTASRAIDSADPIISDQLAALQAFALYIVSSRLNNSSRWSWTMTALLVRIATAQCLGIEDASDTIYIKELKRRLWHFIAYLDLYHALDSTSEPLLGTANQGLPLPTNVNDDDFGPDSTFLRPRDHQFTDMTFVLFTYEIRPIASHLGSESAALTRETWQDRLLYAKSMLNTLEQRYLPLCDPNQPFHRLLTITVRRAQSSMILRAVRPIMKSASATPPPVSSTWVLQLAVDQLRRICSMYEDPSICIWPVLPWIPWHAVAVTLTGLCTSQASPLADEAWTLVLQTVDIYKPYMMAGSASNTMWPAVQRLLKKAEHIRRGHSQPPSLSMSTSPTGVLGRSVAFPPSVEMPSNMQGMNTTPQVAREQYPFLQQVTDPAPFETIVDMPVAPDEYTMDWQFWEDTFGNLN